MLTSPQRGQTLLLIVMALALSLQAHTITASALAEALELLLHKGILQNRLSIEMLRRDNGSAIRRVVESCWRYSLDQ